LEENYTYHAAKWPEKSLLDESPERNEICHRSSVSPIVNTTKAKAVALKLLGKCRRDEESLGVGIMAGPER